MKFLLILLIISLLLCLKKIFEQKAQILSLSNKSSNRTPKPDYNAVINQEKLNIMSHPEQYYYRKRMCMNDKEAYMYYGISCALQKIFSQKEIENYFIFPQMSLHALYNTTSAVNSRNSQKSYEPQKTINDLPRRMLVSKNVDFVLCQKVYNGCYNYAPILLIEIDDFSHTSPAKYGLESFERQQESDRYKNTLCTNFDVPLLRYRLLDDDVHKPDLNGIYRALNDFFNNYVQKNHTVYIYDRNGQIYE